MRQNLLKNLLAVFLLVMSTGLAMSQGVTTSGITGTVTEANGPIRSAMPPQTPAMILSRER